MANKILPVADALNILAAKISGGDKTPQASTKVDALKEIYAALGGEDENVKALSTTTELIQEIAEIVKGGGGGGSGYELIATAEITVTGASTSSQDVGTITPSKPVHQTEKIVYIKIRNKNGKQMGHFYGSDQWISDIAAANDQPTLINYIPKTLYAFNDAGLFAGASNAETYRVSDAVKGVFVKNITGSGTINIAAATNSLVGIVDGVYVVEVYLMDWPNNQSPLIGRPVSGGLQ